MIESKKITEFKKTKMEIENLLSDQKLNRNYELKSQNRQNANDVLEDAKIVGDKMNIIANKVLNISLQMENFKNSLSEDEKRELKQLDFLSEDKQTEKRN